MDDYPRDHKHPCPECGAVMMDPTPAGEPGDDHYYCDACGATERQVEARQHYDTP